MFKKLYFIFIVYFFSNFPGRVGVKLRSLFYKPLFSNFGNNIVIGIGVRFNNPENIFLEDNIWIDDYCILISGVANEGERHIHRKSNEFYHFNTGELHINKGVHIAPYVMIQAHGGVSIGRYCTIGSGSKIFTLSHHYKTVGSEPVAGLVCQYSTMAPQQNQSLIIGPVVIEDNAAVLPNCVLLSGATLAKGTWLLIGSVLRESTPAFKLLSGNPAKVLKDREVG